MEPSFLIGFLASFGVVAFGIISGKGSVGDFIDVASILIVVVGTFTALIACYPFSTLKNIPKHMMIVMKGQQLDPLQYIDNIVDCAQIARKNGLLALEEYANQQEDIFLKSSLLLIVDAIDADKVREVLENDLAHLEARHGEGISLYERGAALSPAFGMIGTLVGLIIMLKSIDLGSGDTTALTDGMALALITTFYGSVLANVFFAPIASKLQLRHDREYLCKEIVIEGILSIQAGENPKLIREKLVSFLASNSREAVDESGEGGEGEGGKKKKEKKSKKKDKE